MSDLRTISPDELPELSEIPDDLRAVVFSPAGPLQSVAYERLLTKLIATDLSKPDKAALDADLAHPADSVALVFADATAALNGWYRKLGAPGAGNWEQFEELSRNVRLAAEAALQAATDEANRAVEAATAAGEATSSVSADDFPVSRQAGPGAEPATNAASSITNFYVFPPFDVDGNLESLALYCGTGGAGNISFKLFDCDAAGDVTGVAADLGTEVWASSGVQTKTFTGQQVQRGQRIGFRRTATNAGTFHFIASAANGIVDTFAGDIAGAATLTKTNSSIPTYSITFKEQVGKQGLVERLDALEARAGQAGAAAVGVPQFRHGIDTATNLGVKTLGYGPARPFDRAGRLARLRIDVTTTGLFQVILASPDGSNFVPQQVFLINATATGWQTFEAGTDYDPADVREGWRLFINPAGGGFSINTGLNNALYYTLPIPTRVGATSAITAVSGALLGFDCELDGVSESLTDLIASEGERLRGATVLESQLFPGTATPAGWTLNGWTVNEGAVSPAAGAWTAYLGRASIPNATRRTARMKFTINTASTSIVSGIVFYGANSGAVVLDCASGAPMLQLFGSSAGGSPTWTKRAEVAVPFAVAPGTTTGRRYTLEVRRIDNKLVATLWDAKSRESVTLTVDTNAYSAVRLKALTGVGPVLVAGSGSAGDVTVTQFDDVIDCQSNAHAIIIGDSIGEGSNQTDDAPQSWPQLVDAARQRGDILVCATAGDGTNNVNYLDAVFAAFAPRYVVLQIGVNDTSDASWRTNMASLISDIEAAGAQPILCTYTPRPDRPSNLKSADIRARYFGAYPYIDVAAAVSEDDLTWLPGKSLADLVHTNSAGTADIKTQAILEQPALLDGARA